MDAITEFVKQVSERFRNPFVFSLAVALIFANWEIPVALFWEYETGTLTRMQFLRQHDVKTCWPIVFAFLYCAIIPFVSQLIHVWSTLINSTGNEKALKIAKEHPISGEVHFKQVTEMERVKKNYVDAMTSYEKVVTERDTSRGEAKIANDQLISVKQELQDEKKNKEATIEQKRKEINTDVNGILKIMLGFEDVVLLMEQKHPRYLEIVRDRLNDKNTTQS